MKTESKQDSQWQDSLSKNTHDLIIWLWFRKEIEKQYSYEVQKLCKSSGFGLIKNEKKFSILDLEPSEKILNLVKVTTLLLISLVFSVESITFSTSVTIYLASIKLIAIFVILCRLAHWNNSNYISLIITIYVYLAIAQVDAITFLNHLWLSVLYKILLKKLRNIITFSSIFIKVQVSNNKVVSKWNNSRFKKNVVGKRIRDTIKFRFVTIAL